MSTPTADDLRFAAELDRANAEAWLADEGDGASDDDKLATRCDLVISEFFLTHYGREPAAVTELRASADWLDERAAVLRKQADDIPVKGPASPNVGVSRNLRDEAARFEGRAAVIRQTILKATQGA